MTLTLPAEFHGWEPTPLLAWVRPHGSVSQLAQLWQRGTERRWLLVPHFSSDALPEASQFLAVCGGPAFPAAAAQLTPQNP